MKMTSKAFLILSALLVSAMALISIVFAQGDPDALRPGEIITGIVEFDGARVYAGPDFAYDIVGELQLYMSVTVVGRRGDFFYGWDGRQWLEIEFEGETAWVYARLIRTSVPFNNIPPTGRPLPRNFDGRVPSEFDLSDDVCDQWTGEFTRSGDFLSGDNMITVTYPELPGANLYSVIVISPYGERTAHDSLTTTAEILLENLNQAGGTYTWRVAPYLALSPYRSEWQQICLLQTGGTFEKSGPIITPRPTNQRYFRFQPTPMATSTPLPFVP